MNSRCHCIVPDCKATDKNISKYRFPMNARVGEKWLNVICNPVLRNIPYHEIREKRYVVCEEHFEKNAWYQTSRCKRLISDSVPTLRLPDSQNWAPIYNHPGNEIDVKSYDRENFSNNDENKDETMVDDIFAQDFSSSFKYSDSPNCLELIHFELPIRERDISESFKIIDPFLMQFGRKESGCKKKNSLVVFQTPERPSTDYLKRAEPSFENISPGLDFVIENVQDISEEMKKPRSELENGDAGSAEEPAVIEINRDECNLDNTEDEMDVAAFEVLQSENEEESNKFPFEEAEYAGITNIGCEVFNTEKNIIKRQKYKTTIKLKRHSKENGKIVEDIFIIEHTFMSTCKEYLEHENDTVSCKIEKVK